MQDHDTNRCMQQLYAYMSADAFNATGGLINMQHVSTLCRTDIAKYRNYIYPAKMQAPVYIFKWCYQLENIHKRFTFTDDVFTKKELASQLNEKFVATQLRLRPYIPQTTLIRRVLSGARTIVDSILGHYDLARHIELCTFGTEAAVGVPSSESYPDTRLDRPLSGSVNHIQWFISNVLQEDHILQKTLRSSKNVKGDIFCPESSRYSRCDVLRMTGVPKSFKALRGIMPNTELGNFYTSGLGKLIVERLAEAGFDLSRRAEKHAQWVKTFSVNRTHVTADLSAASDSFTAPLINALVPREWYKALKLGRISHVDCGDGAQYMNTFMTMGIGFTFPLQTLLFYAIIKSVAKLCGSRGIISVFGDDLIFPRFIYKEVVSVLEQLGFVINRDKTFCTSYFRESCGSDFFHGVDVRPFQPEGEGAILKGRAYASFLYRLVNGLRRRWEYEEIPYTLSFLIQELKKTGYRIYQVPPDFPDHSGWQVKRFTSDAWFQPVGFDASTFCHTFTYIKIGSPNRAVENQYPYYWNWYVRKMMGNEVSIYTKVIPPIKWVLKKVRAHGGRFRKWLIPYTSTKRHPVLASQKTHTSSWGLCRR